MSEEKRPETNEGTWIDFVETFAGAIFAEVALSLITVAVAPTVPVGGVERRNYVLASLVALAACVIAIVAGIFIMDRNRARAIGLIFSVPVGLFLAFVLMGPAQYP